MLTKITKLLKDSSTLAMIWREARTAGIKRFGPVQGVKNLCAATASGLLMKAGILDNRVWLVKDLAAALEHRAWFKYTHPTDLLLGDLVITQDRNDKKGPDHTCFIIEVYDAAPVYPALIFDNYSAKAHLRNLGRAGLYKGHYLAKTPMEYALRCPDGSTKELGPVLKAVALSAFRSLYGIVDGENFSPETKQALNILRARPEFNNLT